MVFIRSLTRQLRRPASSVLSGSAFAPKPVSGAFSHARTLTATAMNQGKVLMVLYDVSLSLYQGSESEIPS